MLANKIKIDETVKVKNNIFNFLMPEKVYFECNDDIKNKYVYKCENISNIISPISGNLTKQDKSIVIENDYRELKIDDRGITKIKDKYELKEIKLALKKIGCKNIFNDKKEIIVNAISSNPYDVTNIFLFRENIYMLLESLNALRTSFGIKKATIYVSSNYSDMITKILDKMGSFPYLSLKVVETIYPLENNEALKRYLSIRKSKSKAFIKLNDLYNLGYYFKRGMMPIEKLITISGDMVKNPLVIFTKKGTKLKDILSVINLKSKDVIYVLNNILFGKEINPDDYYINENTSSIIIITKTEYNATNCIKCGLCYKVCPLKTKPNSKICIKCGLCSYYCPAKIDLLGGSNETIH